ncbi:43425_t:CDS:2 [Gigaspora margarita]|uniref:43425_t:CDS:1 n=1 Tax=Gigaspora margarita TaxID=4874 RepID=A0ABN7W1D0_GIGMA|nr:43425_t:CDS:2 [Gigaspora margarita]
MSSKKVSHDPNNKMKRLMNLQIWFKDNDVIEYEYFYENKKEIGSGGFGTVYSAERDGEIFALKSFKNNDVNNEATKEFIKEHSKNILINNNKFLIADFGLSRKIGDTYSSSNSITKGMPAYLDPHCCCQPGKKPDEKSDIYSLGVIFWELTSGIPPFANANHGITIIFQAFSGYREKTIPGTPTEYANIYKKCWNIEPKERPTICKILENLNAISKRETITFITNRNRELTPELDPKISNQSQFYKNMLNDDLSKIYLIPTWFRRSSNPSPKPSLDSLPKASIRKIP